VPLDEDSKKFPTSNYGVSKLEGEKLISELLPNNSLIIRIPWAYGENMSKSHHLARLFETVRRRGLVGYIDWPGQISLISIENFARAFTNLLSSGTLGVVHVYDEHMTFGNISTEGICYLKKLKWLYVMGCARVSHCQGFQHLPLAHVHLTNCSIPDENMCYLSHVAVLSFYGVTYLGGTQFSNLTNAHTLSIFKLTIENEMVEDIVKMPNLKEMYMYDCYVSPEIKQQLRKVLPLIRMN
jgi:hypothetical protein